MSTPTAGALRAARALSARISPLASQDWHEAVIPTYARLVDSTTGLPELIAALKELLCWVGQEGTPAENGCKCETRSDARLLLKRALAKAEGK